MKNLLLILMLFVVCSPGKELSCLDQKNQAWSQLEEKVDQGYIFASIQWFEDGCRWELVPGEFYLVDEVRWRGFQVGSLELRKRWSQLDTSSWKDQVKAKIDFIEGLGYFNVIGVQIQQDSLRRKVYPVVYIEEVPSSQFEAVIDGNQSIQKSLFTLKLNNIKQSLTNFYIHWFQSEQVQELNLNAEKHFVLNTDWSLQSQYYFYRADSTFQFDKVGLSGVHRDEDSWQYGLLYNRIWGLQGGHFEIDETGVGLEYGHLHLKWFKNNHYFKSIQMIGVGDENQEQGSYYTHQYFGVLNLGTILIPGLNLVHGHGGQYHISGNPEIWNGFQVNNPRVMRLLDERIFPEFYQSWALEYSKYIGEYTSMTGFVEWDEWQSRGWNSQWGPGVSFQYTNRSWEILVSWIFPWNSSLENSRIIVGLTNKF